MDVVELIWIIAVTLLTLLNIIWQFDLQMRQRRLQERYERAFQMGEGGSPAAVAAVKEYVDRVQGRVEGLESLARQIEATLGHSVQGVGMVRFRAYQDTGGDQSFALALVDGSGNGVVISSLHGREDTHVYGKPLAAWTSAYSLSGEEMQAIEQARAMVQGS